MRRLFSFVMTAFCCLNEFAVEAPVASNEKVDRSDPNFVSASLVIAAPGGALFSCAGHAFIRLECPRYKLDYCFSYESEPIPGRIFSFFAGRLKMGMFAVPTGEFLKQYENDCRGAVQYKFNLTPEAKQRLWKIMDDKAAGGANLPYDYLRRGCAWSVLGCIREAILPDKMEIAAWPEKYAKTRREIASSAVAVYRWNQFVLQAIWGTELDREVSNIEKVLIPVDLLEFLRATSVNGIPIITEEGVVVKPQMDKVPDSIVTPMIAAVLFVLLVGVNCFWRKRYLDWLILLLQSVAGVFFTYMVCFSHLPATDWNWLIVPFNPLPLVFWRWRRWWAWPFVAVLVAWEAFMLFSPHQLTDPAYLVIVLAYAIFYAKVARKDQVA